MPQYIFFLFSLKEVEKGSQAKTKVKSKKHTMASIFILFFKLGFN